MNKRILIVNPGSLFPTFAMNQVRTLHMIKSLNKYFEVEVVTPVKSNSELENSIVGFDKLGIRFYHLHSKKHKSNFLRKRYHQFVERFYYYTFGVDKDFIASKQYEKDILKLIQTQHYDIIISNYWEISDFFRHVNDGTIKILDTHYAVKENLEVFRKNGYQLGLPLFKKRELLHSISIEKRIAEASDIIISLSSKCHSIFNQDFPAKKHLLIADGNDINHFVDLNNNPKNNTIIFYGSMGSLQNVGAFWRTYNKILPIIRQQIPDINLIVVGNKPPIEIRNLHNGADIIITGFVEDVRPWLSKGKLMILPLEIGSGFRGRIVEVMGMGLPVIGTHNALDSLEMESGKQGLISDNDQEMADYCIRLLMDETLRIRHSNACRQFVVEQYSLEATFDKLTEYLVKYSI